MSDVVERLRSRKEPTIEVDMHYPQIVDSDTPDAECIEAADEITRLRAEVERLRAALEAICMMDISWVGDAFKLKDIARAALGDTHE